METDAVWGILWPSSKPGLAVFQPCPGGVESISKNTNRNACINVHSNVVVYQK